MYALGWHPISVFVSDQGLIRLWNRGQSLKLTILRKWCHNSDQLRFILLTKLCQISMFLNNFGVFLKKSVSNWEIIYPQLGKTAWNCGISLIENGVHNRSYIGPWLAPAGCCVQLCVHERMHFCLRIDLCDTLRIECFRNVTILCA